jgi:transketolase
MTTPLDTMCINTIRFLAVDAVQAAKSGHPGMPMGAAPMAYTLFTRHLRHNPANPSWPDRDRFVLSAGHGSMLLYSLLHLTGYDLPLSELERFRQWGSATPGHPEFGHTPGVETTTGPLGQGFANAVGMAIAERHLAARFNRPGHTVVDHRTYVLVGDGDLMEGISAEAASLAGHLKLGKLICLYDDNRITIEGSTDLAFTEDRAGRFEAYGWQVLVVEDGNDVTAVDAAIREAKAEDRRPSLVVVRTTIGYGSPNRADTASAHGEPLGEAEVSLTKEAMGWPPSPSFLVPGEVTECFRKSLAAGMAAEEEWLDRFRLWAGAHRDLASEWRRIVAGELPEGWDSGLPSFPVDAKGKATREASGVALNALAGRLPELMGGSADLAPSNKTVISGSGDFQADAWGGRNLRFGVREHAMGGIANGLALHGGIRPYVATFLIFADYLRPSIRLAALMRQRVIYVFTHDSIGVGEDGPTHQPVEHLASLRAIPGLTVIRPADANETVAAWREAIARPDGPTALILSRQALPTLAGGSAAGLARGAYVLAEASRTPADLILMATGSEVEIALAAAAKLEAEGVATRVVSFPSWELFEAQSPEYRETILPKAIGARIAVEAAIAQGWCRWLGGEGEFVGMERFGASAPAPVLYREFGITADAVVAKARRRP